MELKYELKEIKKVLDSKKSIALLAPSFVVDFEYPKVILELRRMGFDKVVELTYAAKIISERYHKLIKENPDKQFICANCPSIVKYIESKFPEIKDNIADIVSPMVLMGRIVKKIYGEKFKIVFIGPCYTKKQEAKEYGNIDYAITFRELKEMLIYYKESKELKKIFNISEKNILDFDKFYNDYTKIYPLAGGVAKTMHIRNILTKNEVYIADGIENINLAINKFKRNKNIRFLDLLFCKGGCIGGPGIISDEPINKRTKKILKYIEDSKKHKIGKKLGKLYFARKINIKRKRI